VVALTALSAITVLSGCDNKPTNTAVSATADQPTPAAAAGPGSSTPLPSADALTSVLYRLADPSVPGAQKINLVEGATADDAAQLDKFGKALADSGYTPLTFDATDIAWSDTVPGDVATQVTVHSANSSTGNGFTFPMQFKPYFSTWQLSRNTAETLLTLAAPTAAPPPPGPPPTPTP
jgi:hypothetical protein